MLETSRGKGIDVSYNSKELKDLKGLKNLENIEYQKNKFKKILEKFFGLPNFLPNFVCFWKN